MNKETKEVKKEVTPEEVKPVNGAPEKEAPKLRQIILETDGTNVKISKDETYGIIELVGILEITINALRKS